MSNIKNNITEILAKIADAAKFAGRKPEDVKLIAVSKNVSHELMKEAYEAGLRRFGENRVQELEKKVPLMPEDIQWHMIGHLQSNKAAKAVKYAEYIHSVDSIALLEKIERICKAEGRKIKILAEVNISGEESKFGFRCDKVLMNFCEKAVQMSFANFAGLMTMAPYSAAESELRKIFSQLRTTAEKIKSSFKLDFMELSMGMSGDFKIAIEEGATMVRIGTAIFSKK